MSQNTRLVGKPRIGPVKGTAGIVETPGINQYMRQQFEWAGIISVQVVGKGERFDRLLLVTQFPVGNPHIYIGGCARGDPVGSIPKMHECSLKITGFQAGKPRFNMLIVW